MTSFTLPRKTVQQIMAFAQAEPSHSRVAYLDQHKRFSPQRSDQAWAVVVTHPSADTLPTEADREQLGPEQLLMVLSLNTKGVLEIQGWDYGQATPEAIELKI